MVPVQKSLMSFTKKFFYQVIFEWKIGAYLSQDFKPDNAPPIDQNFFLTNVIWIGLVRTIALCSQLSYKEFFFFFFYVNHTRNWLLSNWYARLLSSCSQLSYKELTALQFPRWYTTIILKKLFNMFKFFTKVGHVDEAVKIWNHYLDLKTSISQLPRNFSEYSALLVMSDD